QYHHEKFDGSGYMSGLTGKMIPVNARVFAIVDVFDALTSDRPYKNALSYSESISLIKKGASSHFDPDFVRSFENISKDLYLKISNLKTEDDLSRELDSLMEDYFVI
ncbi:MAG TPA: HD domain-containing phosphohydrolase, partial [Nitrosomonas nitrosa]|nr:HD domain-containing phosphohydrolase [Nitrosomonas nitrosa]